MSSIQPIHSSTLPAIPSSALYSPQEKGKISPEAEASAKESEASAKIEEIKKNILQSDEFSEEIIQEAGKSSTKLKWSVVAAGVAIVSGYYFIRSGRIGMPSLLDQNISSAASSISTAASSVTSAVIPTQSSPLTSAELSPELIAQIPQFIEDLKKLKPTTSGVSIACTIS